MNGQGKKAFLMFFLLSLLPAELYLNLGGVRIEMYRVFLLIYTLWALPTFFKMKYEAFEWWLFLAAGWFMASYLVNHGTGGIQSGVIKILETLIVYLIGRHLTYCNGREGLVWALKVISWSFFLFIPLALVESQTGIRITHVIAAKLAGTYAQEFVGYNYYRMGVFRSSVIYSHPILYSMIAMSFVFLMWFVLGRKQRRLFVWGYVVAAYTAMTSAGIIMAMLQLGFFIMDKIARRISIFRKLVLTFFIAVLVIVELFSDRGAVKFVIGTIALDPHTAYTRYMQWQFGWDDVVDNYMFGIGFHQWTRPPWMHETVDSFWLITGITHGFLGLTIVAVFWYGLQAYLLKNYFRYKEYIFHVMWGAIMALIFAGMTVAFFDRSQTFIHMLMGLMVGFAKHFDMERKSSSYTTKSSVSSAKGGAANRP